MPNPLTIVPNSSNLKVLNLLTSTVPPNIINKNNFKVKGAIIKKNKDAALKNKMLNNDIKILKKIKKKKKQEFNNKKY